MKSPFNNAPFNNNEQYLMLFGCHHKVGTSWFSKILPHIARDFNLQFQYGDQTGINTHTDIFFDDHSRLNPDEFQHYRGVHLIRDPRDIIISGFHYHKWTEEAWANEAKDHWQGMSYKEKLNSLDKHNGLIFEMEHIGRETINEMLAWNYHNKSFLEIKYEDLLVSQQEIFSKIFQHYNFNKQAIKKCLDIADQYNVKKMKKNNAQHLRKGISGDWKNHFTPLLKEQFKKSFPDALSRLNYEQESNW